MQDLMTISLTYNTEDPLKHVLAILKELAKCLKESHDTFIGDIKMVLENIKVCREMRSCRKAFEKNGKKLLQIFPTLTERQQSDVELRYFRLIKDIEIVEETVLKELREEDVLFFSNFLIREITKTVDAFKLTQSKMASILYPDPMVKINSDPALAKKIEDVWADFADDDY